MYVSTESFLLYMCDRDRYRQIGDLVFGPTTVEYEVSAAGRRTHPFIFLREIIASDLTLLLYREMKKMHKSMLQ